MRVVLAHDPLAGLPQGFSAYDIVAVALVEGMLDPCVDGSPLASLNSRLALLVGLASYPTC